MIHIVKQVMSINDTNFVATFFKDITFGVLYEQLRAQEKFKNVMTKTLQYKLWTPIQNVILTCQDLQKSGKLEQFEANDETKELSLKIRSTIIQSKSALYKLEDIRDWIDIYDDKFKVKNLKFDVCKTIKTIIDVMNFRVESQQINLEFEARFYIDDFQRQNDLLLMERSMFR